MQTDLAHALHEGAPGEPTQLQALSRDLVTHGHRRIVPDVHSLRDELPDDGRLVAAEKARAGAAEPLVEYADRDELITAQREVRADDAHPAPIPPRRRRPPARLERSGA